MLIVDNYIYSFALNIENGISIKPYYEGKDDSELKYLSSILSNTKSDMRDFVSIDLGLKNLNKYLGYSG
jgi:TFIIF-interacting CTD phosphatase-like protein